MPTRKPSEYDWSKALFNDRRLSKHFTSPRQSKIKHVTLHHMTIVAPGDGSSSTIALEGCYRTWQTRQASANYGVSGNQVWQYVSDGDAAWANASSSNHETLSIEHANSTAGPGWKVSDKTMETGARLVATLHRLYGLGRPSRKTVRMHRDFYATACPGPYMVDRLDEYIAQAARFYDAAGNTSPAKPVTPKPTTPKPTPTKAPVWFTAIGWNLAVSNEHGRATWGTRFPKIISALTTHYSRDVLLFTEAWGAEHDGRARKMLNDAGYSVLIYFAGRAIVARDSIRDGRTKRHTFTETGPAKDKRHMVLAEAWPGGSKALMVCGHLEHREGPAYDTTRVRQAREVMAVVEQTCREWGIGHDRVLIYLDENSRSYVSEQAFKDEWPDAAVHADAYGNKTVSTFVGWDGQTSADGYRPDKVRTHKSRPVRKASTSPTFPKLSDHLPVLIALSRVVKKEQS